MGDCVTMVNIGSSIWLCEKLKSDTTMWTLGNFQGEEAKKHGQSFQMDELLSSIFVIV